MTTVARHVVVVGASQAGSACAAALRTLGFDGRITMIGDEPHPPYTRPPLSKSVLVGAESEQTVFLPELDDVDLVTGITATGLDRDRNVVELADGDGVGFDALVIATGARARRLAPTRGPESVLRTLADASALRDHLATARDVGVLGGGFLGIEIASSAVQLGRSVTLVDQVSPLVDRLGVMLADVFHAAAAEHGVKIRVVRSGVTVGFDDDVPTKIVSADGAALAEADLVVTAAGDVPNVEWLHRSGVPVDGGVLVDRHCRVDSDIVAVGDVATTSGWPGRRARSPHWWNALSQAKLAAAALLGRAPEPAWNTVPFFWTEAFGLSLRLAGRLPPVGEPTLVDGSIADRSALFAWPAGSSGGYGTAAALNFPLSVNKLTKLARQTSTDQRTLR